MAADYAAGEEAIAGFKKGVRGGWRRDRRRSQDAVRHDAGLPALPGQGRAARSPGAVFVFYAGAEAVSFVKQYKEFGLSESVPLYGSGFLTEGGVLTAQGAAADGRAHGLAALRHRSSTTPPTRASPKPTKRRPASRRPCMPSRHGTPPRCSTRAVKAAGALDGDALVGSARQARRDRGQPARAVDASSSRVRRKRCTCAKSREEGGAVTNAVVESLGDASAQAAEHARMVRRQPCQRPQRGRDRMPAVPARHPGCRSCSG